MCLKKSWLTLVVDLGYQSTFICEGHTVLPLNQSWDCHISCLSKATFGLLSGFLIQPAGLWPHGDADHPVVEVARCN